MKACPYCAEEIQDAAIVCRFCNRALTDGAVPPQANQQTVIVHAPTARWNPGVAAVLSFFIPGLGHMYKGEVGIGFALLICTIIGYFLFIVPGALVHLAAIVTAAQGDPYADPRAPIAPRPNPPGYVEPVPMSRRGKLTVAGVLVGTIVTLWLVGLVSDWSLKRETSAADARRSIVADIPLPKRWQIAREMTACIAPTLEAAAAVRSKTDRDCRDKLTAAHTITNDQLMEIMAGDERERGVTGR